MKPVKWQDEAFFTRSDSERSHIHYNPELSSLKMADRVAEGIAHETEDILRVYATGWKPSRRLINYGNYLYAKRAGLLNVQFTYNKRLRHITVPFRHTRVWYHDLVHAHFIECFGIDAYLQTL